MLLKDTAAFLNQPQLTEGSWALRWPAGPTAFGFSDFSLECLMSFCAYFLTIEGAKSLSRVPLIVTSWAVAHQVPLSMGFSRQEYWSGLPCSPPGESSQLRDWTRSLKSPALAAGYFTTSANWDCKVSDFKQHRCAPLACWRSIVLQ